MALPTDHAPVAHASQAQAPTALCLSRLHIRWEAQSLAETRGEEDEGHLSQSRSERQDRYKKCPAKIIYTPPKGWILDGKRLIRGSINHPNWVPGLTSRFDGVHHQNGRSLRVSTEP